jgi:hypothetical protein
MRPYPSKRWRITNERRMNQLGQAVPAHRGQRSEAVGVVCPALLVPVLMSAFGGKADIKFLGPNVR